MAKDIEYYAYDLDKSMLGKIGSIMSDTVAIRPSWEQRMKRYAGKTGLDLKKVFKFVNNGLIDRRMDGFGEKALDGPLSESQKWVLMHLFLKGGVPEYVRNKELDENAPNLIEAEEVNSIVGSVVKGAAKAVSAPVKTLADMVSGSKTEEEVADEVTDEEVTDEEVTEESEESGE